LFKQLLPRAVESANKPFQHSAKDRQSKEFFNLMEIVLAMWNIKG